MMAIIFYICFFILVYIYIIYPAMIFFISIFSGKKVAKLPYEPTVCILISAYNEEKHIRATIENKISLKYPKEKLEIIVVSDGSDDATDKIVESFEGQGVKLLRQEPRKGKTSALNMAIQYATSEIVVFSDANSLYGSDAILRLMENFADPGVGYVTGKMIYVNHDGSVIGDGCSAYMKYENFLRSYESKVGSIVGVDGGIDAVRRKLFRPMEEDQLPDFVLPLMVVGQGFRVVYEPSAILKEYALASAYDEYKMRVRVSLRALWALIDMATLLDIRRFGLFSLQLFSHKYLRYVAFIFMAGAYLFNAFLLEISFFYMLIFVMQTIFYVSGLIAHFLLRQNRKIGFLYIPYYFILVNIAAGHALIRLCRGEKQVLWTPRKG